MAIASDKRSGVDCLAFGDILGAERCGILAVPELTAVGVDGTAKGAVGPAEVQSERRIVGLALLERNGRSQREEGQSSEELHCDLLF